MGKKVIAVAGATGAQGGGLVRAILAEPEVPAAGRKGPARKMPPAARPRVPS